MLNTMNKSIRWWGRRNNSVAFRWEIFTWLRVLLYFYVSIQFIYVSSSYIHSFNISFMLLSFLKHLRGTKGEKGRKSFTLERSVEMNECHGNFLIRGREWKLPHWSFFFWLFSKILSICKCLSLEITLLIQNKFIAIHLSIFWLPSSLLIVTCPMFLLLICPPYSL